LKPLIDPRKGNAQYYDLEENPLDDAPFYLARADKEKSVLELGVGTGRVLIPLAPRCKEILGIDYSSDMIDRCRSKIKALPSDARAEAEVGDITNLNLHRAFDLIIAPYRVIQALESDRDLDGFFETIRRHLSPNGTAIINAFHPKSGKDELRKNWRQPNESLCWQKVLPDGTRVVHSEWYEKMDPERMVLYPQLIYRKYQGDELLEEFIQPIKMRCHYPDEFRNLVESRGFQIRNSWGGYGGEAYGQGRELVIEFSSRPPWCDASTAQ
jgi:ubiquinone/menaquinone biosynthesis C-methylase UbiE